MKTIFALVFTLVSAFGQANDPKPAAPASQEDVRGLQREIQRLQREGREARKAALNAAAKDAVAHQKMVEENAAAQQRAEAKLESIAREARQANDNQLRTQRIVWSVIGGAVLFGIFLAWLLIRKSRVSKVVIIPSSMKEGEPIPEKIFDPGLHEIKRALEKKPEQLFTLILPGGSDRPSQVVDECVARLIDGEVRITHMEGKPISPVAWDKRRVSAAKFIAAKN